MKTICILPNVLLLLFCSPNNLQSQDQSLTMQVHDPSGLSIPGALISVSTLSGIEVTSRQTQASGKTMFTIASGSYQLNVAAPGFAPYQEKLVVTSREPVNLVVELQVASLALKVNIVANPTPQIQTEVIPQDVLKDSFPRDLAETLKVVPGVLTTRRGPINLEPVIQGLRENQIVMIVDGTRTFAAGPARMDSEISHVNPTQVSSVEVIKGPYALREGSGLSTILVKTDPVPVYDATTVGGNISTGYGFNGAKRFGQTHFFVASQRVGMNLRASGGQGNNYNSGNRNGMLVSVPGGYNQNQLGSKVRVSLTPNQVFNFDSGFNTKTDVDYPGRLLNAEHFITRSWNGDYYVKVSGQSIESVHLKLYLNKKSHRMSNNGKPTALDMPGRMPPFGLDVSLPTKSVTLGGSGQVRFQPKLGWEIQTGFDFYKLDQEAIRFISRRSNGMLLFRDKVWPDTRTRNQGFYLYSAKSHTDWGMAATLRFDRIQANALSPSDFFLANTTGNMKQDEFNTSWSLTTRRNLAKGVTLSGGLGRAVRTANALERYSDRFPSTNFQIAAEFMGTPTIRPETSYQGDLALKLSWAGMTLRVGAFYRRINDFITVAPTPTIVRRLPLSPSMVYQYISGDHANFRGLDCTFRLPIRKKLELRIQGMHMLADDIEESFASIGINEPLLGIPPFEIQTKLIYGGVSLPFFGEVAMRNVWRQDRVATSRLESSSPGFSTFNLRGGLRLPLNFLLQIGVENLGNKFYFEHLNSLNSFTHQRIPEFGRNVFLSLNKRFGS